MIDISEIENGQHCWAKCKHTGKLLVVLRTQGWFEVCGGWECGIPDSEVEIIEVIEKPHTERDAKLYYDHS